MFMGLSISMNTTENTVNGMVMNTSRMNGSKEVMGFMLLRFQWGTMTMPRARMMASLPTTSGPDTLKSSLSP